MGANVAVWRIVIITLDILLFAMSVKGFGGPAGPVAPVEPAKNCQDITTITTFRNTREMN